ncbi:cyclic-di-AMP receptor, partial [Candidatus Darwinibacter acetoxidans]
MKLLITIVQDQDVPALIEALMEHDFRATKLAST